MVVSSFMYFKMHVLELLSKVCVFGCTKRLKQHRVKEKKGTVKGNEDRSGSSENC